MQDPAPDPDDITPRIAAGIAGRLRALVISLDRLDRLESGSGEWRARFEQHELPEAALELTLRGLRTAADPLNFTILRTLCAAESHSLNALIEATGLGRLPLSERLNDLVQVGMAVRLIDTDHAQITPAGAGMVQLIETLASLAQRSYAQANR